MITQTSGLSTKPMKYVKIIAMFINLVWNAFLWTLHKLIQLFASDQYPLPGTLSEMLFHIFRWIFCCLIGPEVRQLFPQKCSIDGMRLATWWFWTSAGINHSGEASFSLPQGKLARPTKNLNIAGRWYIFISKLFFTEISHTPFVPIVMQHSGWLDHRRVIVRISQNL